MSEDAWVRACQGGSRLLVRAQPGARRDGPAGLWNGRIKIALRSPPQDGRANEELCGLLARRLGLRAGQVELVGGAHSRQKELFVPLAPELVRERLLPGGDGAQ